MTITTKDFVQDIAKFAISTGFFEKIKISATATKVVIEAVGNDREVILKGSCDPINGLEGEFGLSNTGLLTHMTNDSLFSDAASTLEVVYETRNAKRIPTELNYVNKSKSHINYRFMSAEHMPQQPVFNTPIWDVTVVPTKSNVQQFAWAASGLGSYEEYFIPKVVDQQLKFFIGEEKAASQRGGVVFAEDINNKFDPGMQWKIAPILSVLKLAESADGEISFSSKGAIQATLKTGISNYQFIFPAKAK